MTNSGACCTNNVSRHIQVRRHHFVAKDAYSRAMAGALLPLGGGYFPPLLPALAGIFWHTARTPFRPRSILFRAEKKTPLKRGYLLVGRLIFSREREQSRQYQYFSPALLQGRVFQVPLFAQPVQVPPVAPAGPVAREWVQERVRESEWGR